MASAGSLTDRYEALAVVEEARQAGVPVYGHTHTVRAVRPGATADCHDFTAEVVRAGLSGVMHSESAPPGPEYFPESLPADPQSADEQGIQLTSRWLSTGDQAVQALIDVLVENGAWLEPTLVAYDVYAHPDGYPGEDVVGQTVGEYNGLDEAMFRKGGPFRRWPQMPERAEDFVRRFHEAGGLVIVGSDGAPMYGWGTHDEMRD